MRWHLMGMLLAWAGGVGAQTATLQIEVPQAPVAVRVGAVDHLVYELHLRNSSTEPMTIGSVEVLTGDPARRLLLLEGDTLCKQFEALEPPARKRPACQLPASGLALVYFWQPVSIASGTRLVHRVGTDTGAVHHVALACSGHDGMIERLDRMGLPHRGNHVVAIDLKQIFVRDPNGVLLELNYRKGQH